MTADNLKKERIEKGDGRYLYLYSWLTASPLRVEEEGAPDNGGEGRSQPGKEGQTR